MLLKAVWQPRSTLIRPPTLDLAILVGGTLTLIVLKDESLVVGCRENLMAQAQLLRLPVRLSLPQLLPPAGMTLNLPRMVGLPVVTRLPAVRVRAVLVLRVELTIGWGVPLVWKFGKWHPPVALPQVPPTVVLMLVVGTAIAVASPVLPMLEVATPNMPSSTSFSPLEASAFPRNKAL